MADKSPHHSKDKKKGKTLQEKRAAKRQKRAERKIAEEARNRAEGLELAKERDGAFGLGWWTAVSTHPDRQSLLTERLRLRPFRPGDVEAVARYRARLRGTRPGEGGRPRRQPPRGLDPPDDKARHALEGRRA